MAGEFLRRNLQVIVFAQSRLSTEILTTYLKEDFADVPGMPETIRGYRGGYLPLRRREIERGLREGSVRGVVSTNALELGIDIGALDVGGARRLSGHDRVDVAARRPRRPPHGAVGGRAGRLERAGRSVRRAAPVVFLRRLARARAASTPTTSTSSWSTSSARRSSCRSRPTRRSARSSVQEVLGVLQEAGLVHRSAPAVAMTTSATGSGTGRASRIRPTPSACGRSRRTTSSSSIRRTSAKVIAETDFKSGPPVLHPKAIYILEGRLFQVERLDFEGRKAYVREVDCDYYTDAITTPRSPSSIGSPPTRQQVAHHGEVHVVSRVVGFKKIKFYTNENVGSGELDLPEQQMHTTSYWLEIPLELLAALPYATDDRRDGIFGLAFAMKQIAALLLMCDGRDLGLVDQRRGRRRWRARRWPAVRATVADRRHAAHLPLRCLSRRHRLQRSRCSRCTRTCCGGRAI